VNKKASVLMISLWILAILVVFALGLGQRATINLRLAGYQKDKIKAACLAEAGIKRAIVELEKDAQKNTYDTLYETWSTGKDDSNNNIFENIEIVPGEDEKFSVKVTDEERKININTAPVELLIALLNSPDIDIQDAAEVAASIVNWINTSREPVFKNAPLKTPEELLLALEYFYEQKESPEKSRDKAYETFSKIKDKVTVWGEQLNLNTASDDVLIMLANSVAQTNEEKNLVAGFVGEINNLKEKQDILALRQTDEIDAIIASKSEYNNLWVNLKPKVSTQSQFFSIKSEGKVGNITKKITVVYNRGQKSFVYRHEN